MTNCRYCKRDYDEADAADARSHTETATCTSPCSRCRDKPGCYNCGSSFCFCGTH